MSEQWDGRPQNPERDGWHLIRTDDGVEYVVRWSVARGWLDGELVIYAAESIYGGPLLLPAEVAAQVEAARRDEREACAAVADEWAQAGRINAMGSHEEILRAEGRQDAASDIAAAIRARGDA
jgi:hypothetical protein